MDFETFLQKHKIDFTSAKEAGLFEGIYDPEAARMEAIKR